MEIIEESKNYSDKEEEEEEDTIIREERFSQQDAPSINFNTDIDLMDLSLGNKDIDEAPVSTHGGGCSSSSGVRASGCGSSGHGSNYNYGISSSGHESMEKEHMFDKVVTPSDVGKLNRLVIPKQHAEKYFPLDSSSNDKGLLLNFEDRNGKSWRFRYSYWNSSQSYVMTKGWSRFVKEKKLDAGDIVSFQRGVGDLHKHRLFIDWRRRPDHHHGTDHAAAGIMSPLLISNHPHLSQYSIRWSGRLYSLPQPLSIARQYPHEHVHQMGYSFHPYHHHHHHHHQQQQQQQQQQHYHHSHGSGRRLMNEVNSSQSSLYCFSSPASSSLQNQPVRPDGDGEVPMVIDSVPIAHHTGKAATSKKLRLFGVNMECSSSADEEPRGCHILSSTVVPVPHVNVALSPNSVPPHHLRSSSSHLPLQLRLPHGGATTMASSYNQARFQEKGESSMPSDLADASMKYFR